MAVEVVVGSDIQLAVPVAPAWDHEFFIPCELDSIRIVTLDESVATDKLELVGDMDERHGHHAPQVALAQVARRCRNIRSHAPLIRIELEIGGDHVLKLPREGVLPASSVRSPIPMLCITALLAAL